MKTYSQLFLLSLAVLISAGRPGYAGTTLRVECFPRTVKQGEVCFIRASGPASLKSIHGEFRKERFPLAFGANQGTYEGLLGVDLDSRPAKYQIKVVALDGESRVHSTALLLKVKKADFGVQKLSLPPSQVDLDRKTLEGVIREAKRLKALFHSSREERLWKGPFLRPVPGESSSAFGLRRIINEQPRSSHTGIDLRAEEGAPVLACNRGIVVLVDELFFSGKSIILDHGWGLYSMYFHLSEALVSEGDGVSTGALLGRVGTTGRSSGPHLHWGIIIKGARVDPLSLLGLNEHLGE